VSFDDGLKTMPCSGGGRRNKGRVKNRAGTSDAFLLMASCKFWREKLLAKLGIKPREVPYMGMKD